MPNDAPIIVDFTQKGGVGKTTFLHNLGMTLAKKSEEIKEKEQRPRILFIDTDPQANLTRNVIEHKINRIMNGQNALVTDFVISEVQRELLLSDARTQQQVAQQQVPQQQVAPLARSRPRSSAAQVIDNIRAKFPAYEIPMRLTNMLESLLLSSNIFEAYDWLVADEIPQPQEVDQKVELISKSLIPVPLTATGVTTDKEAEKEKIVTENETSLYLLGGHQLLFSKYSRSIAVAMEGMIQGGTLASFKTRLRIINYLTRKLAEVGKFDLVLIDVNPTAIDFNGAFVMLSDYFIMPITPKPYSNHAALSMLPIIEQWKTDFDKIYNVATGAGGYPAIKNPPKCLGFYFQQVPFSSGKVNGANPQMIIDEIKEFWKKDFSPFLNGVNMGGGTDISEDTYINVFDNTAQDLQLLGLPVVLGDGNKNTTIAKAKTRFKNAAYHAFKGELNSLPDKLANVIKLLGQEKEKEVQNFVASWEELSKHYIDKLTIEQRVKWIKRGKYFYDFYDFKLLLNSLSKKNKFKEDILILDPFQLSEVIDYNAPRDKDTNIDQQFPEAVKQQLRTIFMDGETWPNFIIVPFSQNGHWRCLRIELNYPEDPKDHECTIDILYDDPYGGLLQHQQERVGAGNKPGNHMQASPNVWGDLKKLLAHFFIVNIRTLCAERINNQNLKFRIIARCKTFDQLGYHRTETMSGLVVLANIHLYLQSKDNNLQPNSYFANAAKVDFIKSLIETKKMNFSEVKSVIVHNVEEKIYSEYNLTEQRGKDRKDKYQEIFTKIFPEFGKGAEKIKLYKILIAQYQKQSDIVLWQTAMVEWIDNYVKIGLNRIEPNMRPVLLHLFTQRVQEHSECVLDFIALCYERAYRQRKTEFKQKELFADVYFRGAKEDLRKIYDIKQEDSHYPKIISRDLPATVVLESAPKLPSKDVHDILRHLGFNRYRTRGDGNCYFHALAIAKSKYDNEQLSDQQLYDRAKDYRRRGVEYLRNHPELHQEFNITEDYLNKISQDAEYAEGPIINIMQYVLNVGLVILNYENGELDYILTMANQQQGNDNNIYIYRSHGGQHYEALHKADVVQNDEPDVAANNNNRGIAFKDGVFILSFSDLDAAHQTLKELHRLSYNKIRINLDVKHDGSDNELNNVVYTIALKKEEYSSILASNPELIVPQQPNNPVEGNNIIRLHVPNRQSDPKLPDPLVKRNANDDDSAHLNDKKKMKR